MNLFEIDLNPGVADISASRDKYGSVQVISDNHFAYIALWKQSKNLLFWFSLVGVVVGFIAMLVLRAIGHSLDMVVDQANAIGERRLMTIAEPRISELKALARAMNGMVERVWKLFNEEASRIDDLRRRVNYDQLTNLSNREYFMAHFKTHLTATESARSGVVVLIRLTDLNNINVLLGHAETDKLLREMGQICIDYSLHFEDALSGRIKAGEFAIMLPGESDSLKVVKQLSEILKSTFVHRWPDLPDLYHLGAVGFERFPVERRRGADPAEAVRFLEAFGEVGGVAVKLFRNAAPVHAGAAHFGNFGQRHPGAALRGHAGSADAAAAAADDEKVKIKSRHALLSSWGSANFQLALQITTEFAMRTERLAQPAPPIIRA